MTIVPDGVLFGSDNAHKRLRMELINNQKLIAIISMPSGIFSSGVKKGSASKGTEVKTSFVIFEKTGKGGTDHVWFYDMRNDGFSFGAKRTPIENNDIPDIIKRFENLENEKSNTRTSQSFMVPLNEIVSNDFDLTFNRYKEAEKKQVSFRDTTDIFDDLKKANEELNNNIKNLADILGVNK